MENLFSIALSDLNEKVYFISKKPNFSNDLCFKIIREINKNIRLNYSQEHLHSDNPLLVMDSSIGSKLKVKVSLIGEVSTIIVYDSCTEFFIISLINNRMIEAFYYLLKTKKIKVEMVLKRYVEISSILEDTLYLQDPKVRLNLKEGQSMLSKNVSNHTIYLQKLVRAGSYLRGLTYKHSTNCFEIKKNQLQTPFEPNMEINPKIVKDITFKRNNFVLTYGGSMMNVNFLEGYNHHQHSDKTHHYIPEQNGKANQIDPRRSYSNSNNTALDQTFIAESKEENLFSLDFLSILNKKNSSTFIQTQNSNYMTQNSSLDLTALSSIFMPIEDIFIGSQIKNQLRCSIIVNLYLSKEKGLLLNNKGVYENVKYRGQIGLELNNLRINKKSMNLKVIHKDWNDPNCFIKQCDKSIVTSEDASNYKLMCQNISNFQRVLDYNINVKLVEPIIFFRISGASKENKYKLEIHCALNEKSLINQDVRSADMIIVVVAKSNDIKILKTTHPSLQIEDKSIVLKISNFIQMNQFLVGLLFESSDCNFIEMVKINYRYIGKLPSCLDASLSYLDETNTLVRLDTVKKCMTELRWIL